VRTGVEQHVPAGDADVQGSLADIDGDVSRAQVEELDAIDFVEEREFPIRALGVTGLPQHLGRGFGQRTLVGHGDLDQRLLHAWQGRIHGPHLRWTPVTTSGRCL
jgi:hypothetical protein